MIIETIYRLAPTDGSTATCTDQTTGATQAVTTPPPMPRTSAAMRH